MELDKDRIVSYISEIIEATRQGKLKWSRMNPTTNMSQKATPSGIVKVVVQRANTPKNDYVYLFSMSSDKGILVKFDSSEDKDFSKLLGDLYSMVETSYSDQVYKVFEDFLR